jgi:hypothetical protein
LLFLIRASILYALAAGPPSGLAAGSERGSSIARGPAPVRDLFAPSEPGGLNDEAWLPPQIKYKDCIDRLPW